jgi:hypothetical protein
MADAGRYRFGPLERRGLIAGWRGGQVASVAASLVVAVGVLRARPDLAGFAVAFAAVLAGLGVACWPVAGRTPEEWTPLVARWTVSLLSSGTRRASRLPTAGHLLVEGRIESARGELDGCCLIAPPAGPLRAGVVRDQRSGCYTAVLAVRSHAFALLEAEDKLQRVSSWAGVLAGLAREGSLVHRLQWVERSLPDDGQALVRHLEQRRALARGSAPVRSYEELISAASPVAQRHEAFLAVSVHTGRAARAIRAAGGGDEGACAVLFREVRSLQAQLSSAHVPVDGVLSPRVLSSVLRRGIEVSPLDGRAADLAEADGMVGLGGSPWPLGSETTWSTYRTDAIWHATYWISEWPRVEVGPDFLAPLLLSAGARRTVSVVMEPVSPAKAAREAEQARTAGAADAELRRRGGFMPTARRRREEESLARRETELADGHAQYRFSGYVGVSAPSEEELAAACGAVEQAAGQSRLELRRMYGEQERAFSYTLPLGRGLA